VRSFFLTFQKRRKSGNDAAIGLFGLMSYNVTRRTNEIGIRMALGAQRADVVGMVMRESLILVFIGLILGLAAAWGAGRFPTCSLSPHPPTSAASPPSPAIRRT